MNVLHLLDGAEHACRVPFEGADRVETSGPPCPSCGGTSVVGLGDPETTRDAMESPAACGCGLRRGRIRVVFSTLFGVEEDQRVLAGPWRVF